MSGEIKGTDYVAREVYGAHLRGDALKFAGNNAMNRTALHQRMYTRNLTELAANRFLWKNLPPECDPRFLELGLFYRALMVFFKDKGYNGRPGSDKFFTLRGTPWGQWDIMDNPTKFQVIGNQFQGRTYNAMRSYTETEEGIQQIDPECVPIWANYLRVPDLDIVLIYAGKLAELDVTIEINSRNARRTKVVAVDENQRLTAVNINRQIDQGASLVELAPNGVGALPVAIDLGINPDSLEKLHILKVRLWNECMGMLGINNANQDKKERLVADEVDANNEQVAATRAIALNARRDAADQINELYKLDPPIEVCFRSDEELAAMQKNIPAAPKDLEPSGPRAIESGVA